MEEQFNTSTQGVDNNANAADLQTNQTMDNTQNTNNTVDNTGVNNQHVADANNSNADNEKVEQAFSKRLAHEREKIEKQYSPYVQFIHNEASKYNMTPDQYLQALEQQRQEQERQELIKQGINPDKLNEVVNNHPAIRQAQQYMTQQQQIEDINSEAKEFSDVFPGIKSNDIPKEVWALREQRGLSLLDAYLRVNHQNAIQQAKTQGEQEAIQKLNKNANSSPGSLGSESANYNTSVSKMSTADFNNLVNSVLRGEKTNL